MSLGDFLRYLRAVHGAPTPWEMAEQGGIAAGEYRMIEQCYRVVGSDATLERLAAYFQVPVDELRWRRALSRKLFSAALEQAQKHEQPMTLVLRSGDRLVGRVERFDYGVVLLRRNDGLGEVMVQRHMVDRWESAASEMASPTGLPAERP
ncbi:MAG: hypothetical protein GX605_03705 [Chloroflexi bacterium]|nr:hypothetical protein [Chloroflexota bacterium]